MGVDEKLTPDSITWSGSPYVFLWRAQAAVDAERKRAKKAEYERDLAFHYMVLLQNELRGRVAAAAAAIKELSKPIDEIERGGTL